MNIAVETGTQKNKFYTRVLNFWDKKQTESIIKKWDAGSQIFPYNPKDTKALRELREAERNYITLANMKAESGKIKEIEKAVSMYELVIEVCGKESTAHLTQIANYEKRGMALFRTRGEITLEIENRELNATTRLFLAEALDNLGETDKAKSQRVQAEAQKTFIKYLREKQEDLESTESAEALLDMPPC